LNIYYTNNGKKCQICAQIVQSKNVFVLSHKAIYFNCEPRNKIENRDNL
jgi:hypothetical protein